MLRSGSLITARAALEQGREVFALPWSMFHPGGRGCLGLLRDGAKMVQGIDDILEELRAKTALSPVEFFRLFVEKVGYSSYLQEQIQQEVKNGGNLASQMSAIQQTLRQG